MLSTLFLLSLFFSLVHLVVSQGFTIDTPNLVQCQSSQITWSDTGNSPYDLLVVPAQDVCAYALEDLGNQMSTSMNWIVNVPAGTSVVFSILDSTGQEAWSGSMTIGNSNNTSCLASNPSSSLSPSPTPASTTPYVPLGGASGTHTSTSSAAHISDAAGAANAGLGSSGALSTRPISATAIMGSAVFAVIAFSL